VDAFEVGLKSYFLPPPPMPPVRIDDNWYTWESLYGRIVIEVPLSPAFLQKMSGQSLAESSTTSLAAAAAGSGFAKGPKTPPTKPVKGSIGTVGIAYQEYSPSGTAVAVPSSGLAFPFNRMSLEGSKNPISLPVLNSSLLVENFVKGIKASGLKTGFLLPNNLVQAVDVRKESLGGSNIFNSVNLGVLLSHGFYGTDLDFTSPAQGTFQTYMPFLHNGVNDWLRLSECSFGSANLRWMAVFACNALREENYSSMYKGAVLPINPDLHLLCSASSTVYGAPEILRLWAKYMTKGRTPIGGVETVRDAWFLSAQDAYANPKYSIPSGAVVTMRVAGWPNCMNDKLRLYSPPGTTDLSRITYQEQQVYP